MAEDTAELKADLKRLGSLLHQTVETLDLYDYSKTTLPEMSPEQLERLRSLGYAGD